MLAVALVLGGFRQEFCVMALAAGKAVFVLGEEDTGAALDTCFCPLDCRAGKRIMLVFLARRLVLMGLLSFTAL